MALQPALWVWPDPFWVPGPKTSVPRDPPLWQLWNQPFRHFQGIHQGFPVLSFLMVTGDWLTRTGWKCGTPRGAPPRCFWPMFGMVPLPRDPPCQTPKTNSTPPVRALSVADFEITGGILRRVPHTHCVEVRYSQKWTPLFCLAHVWHGTFVQGSPLSNPKIKLDDTS